MAQNDSFAIREREQQPFRRTYNCGWNWWSSLNICVGINNTHTFIPNCWFYDQRSYLKDISPSVMAEKFLFRHHWWRLALTACVCFFGNRHDQSPPLDQSDGGDACTAICKWQKSRDIDFFAITDGERVVLRQMDICTIFVNLLKIIPFL